MEKKVKELKITPKDFEDVFNYRKNFILMPDSKGFKVGLVLMLKEFTTKYTGRRVSREIVGLKRNSEGLTDGYVVLGME